MFQQIDQLNKDSWDNTGNNPVEALGKAEQALQMSRSGKYPLGIAESLLNIGRCCTATAGYDKALEVLNQAVEQFRVQSGDQAELGEMRSLNALGEASFELQDYESALNYYFMTLTQAEMSGNDEIKILALNNIGEIHNLINNSEEALSYVYQAFQIARQINDEPGMAISRINLGELYLKLNDLAEAEEYFSKALIFSEDNNNTQAIADSCFGLGRIQLAREEYFGAEDKLTRACELYTKIGDISSVAECNYQFSLIGLNNKKYTEAKRYLEDARETAEKLNATGLLSRCMQKLSEIYKAEEDFRKALDFFEVFHKLEEDLRNDNLKNRLKKITILYETEQTETEKEAYRMQSLQLEKSNKEIEFINQIGREITSSLHMDDIIHNTCSRMSEILNITGFGIALYDADNKNIEYNFIVENSERSTPVSVPADSETSLTVWCIKNRKSVLVNKRSEAQKYIKVWSSNSDDPPNSAIFVPMMHGNKLVGCVTVQHTDENAYTENDVDLVQAVSTFLAIAIDNSKVHQELNKLNEIITSEKRGLEVAYRKIAHMANHDTLTDLPNRNLLNELLKRGIRISAREKQKLAVFYMDLDKFKPINDTLGHESGDQVLGIVAERLNETLRTSDTVARIGGDEFVAVLYNIESEEGVMSAAGKIIQSLGEEIVLKGRTFTIGVSIGISIYPDNGTDIDSLLLKADKAMYQAKQAGRNRALFYGK